MFCVASLLLVIFVEGDYYMK